MIPKPVVQREKWREERPLNHRCNTISKPVPEQATALNSPCCRMRWRPVATGRPSWDRHRPSPRPDRPRKQTVSPLATSYLWNWRCAFPSLFSRTVYAPMTWRMLSKPTGHFTSVHLARQELPARSVQPTLCKSWLARLSSVWSTAACSLLWSPQAPAYSLASSPSAPQGLLPARCRSIQWVRRLARLGGTCQDR